MLAIGYIAVLVAAVFYGLMRVAHRRLVKHGTDIYLLAFNLVGFAVLLPFAIITADFPTSPYGWSLLAILGIVLTVSQYLNVKSYEYLEPSARESFIHLDLLLLLFIAAFVLGEPVGTREILGALFIIAGSMLMTIPLGGFRKAISNKGVLLLIGLVIVFAFVGPLNKLNLAHTSFVTITLVGYGAPFLLSLVKNPSRLREVPRFIAQERFVFPFAIGCSLIAYCLTVWSLTRIPVSHSGLIVRFSSVIGFLVAISIYREERQHLLMKSASLSLVLVGVLLTLGGAL